MVQAEAEGVLAERKAELLEESGVQRKGLVEQGWSVQGSQSSTGAWIGMLHLPTAPGQSSRLLCTRPSKGHGSNLTLDVQFESAVKFDHQDLGVHVSGI